MSKKSKFLCAGLFAVFFFVGGLVNAPAAWADRLISYLTNDLVRIAEPTGSIWRGAGTPVINLSAIGAAKAGGSSPEGWQRLSGPISWQAGIDPLSGRLTLALASPDLRWAGPDSRVELSWAGLRLPAAQWTLSPLRLNDLPGVIGLARVSGRFRLAWPELSQSWGPLLDLKSAKLSLEFFDVASALTPIRPLGDYRFTIESSEVPGAFRFSLDSLPESTLRISAQGEWGNAVSVKGQMKCQRFCEYLIGVMATVGRKNGEVYEFIHP